MTNSEIVELLGGVTAVARMLDIKPPSVHNWLTDGIPEGRLRELAGQLEIRSNGRFSRRERWPEKYAFYWPELACVQPATPCKPITPQQHFARLADTLTLQDRRQSQQPFDGPDKRLAGAAGKVA